MNAFCHSYGTACKTLALILLTFSLSTLSAHPVNVRMQTDTAFSVAFELNMAKAISQGIFRPDSDLVYMVMDQGIGTTVLVPAPGQIYTITLPALDSGVTYNFNYRINDSVWESVNHNVTPVNGNTTVSSWWNNNPMNITIFTVNMTYAAGSGLFNPASDSVMIAGTMSNWQPVTLQRVDTSLQFRISYPLNPGEFQQYKFRINADTLTEELQGQPNRIIRITDTLTQATNYFNNINPAWLPMSFVVDMSYYAGSYRFSVAGDFVDVAGNFNGNGANDVLSDVDGDTIYALTTFIDTSYINSGPLTFKFRINGNWATSELPGKPDRVYAFHDTTGGNPNIFGAWYNDLNPAIPTPPWVENLAIQGKLINHRNLSGIYSYENVNGIPEGISEYQWYLSTDSLGINVTPIDSASRITYTIDTTNIGKWIIFEIIPVAAYGDSAVGKATRVISDGKVGGVGIDENEAIVVRVYPNPVSDVMHIETRQEIRSIEICDLMGRPVITAHPSQVKITRLNTGELPAGFYLVRVYGARSGVGVAKFLKR
jgi:hypothetical protein